MPVLSVVGVSHHTCPLDVREQFALGGASALAPAAGERIAESVWLGTCNRTELYALAETAGAAEAAFAETLGVADEVARRYRFTRTGEEAARHLFRVAGGLDSVVVGEHEILGQVRRALAEAQARGSAGPALTRMFQDALTAGKRVRSETAISRCPVSLGGAATSILLEAWIWENLGERSVLILGAGEMARGVARSLKGMQTGGLAIANRSPARARDLAREAGGEALAWPPAPATLARFDAIISCTSAPAFVLTREDIVAAVERLPAGRALHLVDLAVPRDIDPAVATIPGVHLSNLDDARTIVEGSLDKRAEQVAPAERIVEEQLADFRAWLAARSASESIRLLKERADGIRLSELEWAMPKLAGLSRSERAVVEQFSTRLVNKLLHTPTQRLRETAARERPDALDELVQQVFGLEETAAAEEALFDPQADPQADRRP